MSTFRPLGGRVLIVGPMFAQKAEQEPAVHVPAPSKDRPSWVKVGVFAVVGFVVGVAWPRLLNVRLGAAPPENANATAHKEEVPSASASAPVAALSAPPAAVVSGVPATMTAPPKVTLNKGFVLSCKKADGQPLQRAACGHFEAFEGVAAPRLKRLEQCQAVDGLSGTLSVVLDVDFGESRINIEPSDQTTLPSPDGAYACVKAAFQGAPFTTIDHEHPRYRVRYNAKLVAPTPAAATSASPSASAKSGDDQPVEIVVREAKVRDAPNGQLLGTLPRGTKLLARADKNGWWRVHYGQDMASEGFVFHSLIGK